MVVAGATPFEDLGRATLRVSYLSVGMNTPLAILNLLHQKVRTCVAVLGVAFAIVLVFMQLGFLGAVEATATLLYERLDFDLLLVSADFREVNRSGTFPKERLQQVETFTAVEHAAPL